MYTNLHMLPYTKWLALPLGTRVKIASIFNIPKLRGSHVANDQILDDGYNVADVEKAMAIESLQAYLSSTETDVFKLLDALVDQVEGRAKPAPEVVPEIISATATTNPVLDPIPASEPVVVSAKNIDKVVKAIKPKNKRNAQAKTSTQN